MQMLNMKYVAGNLAKKTPHGSLLGGGEHIYIYMYLRPSLGHSLEETHDGA